ncbi:MAG: hypothetical protein AVDCRST_MAG96-12 [uncultured Segetibacter sp.]|uniref:Uncharacterized protein n=1 Tax=uncultured Segetibacter sp. TaxID=481133 RepID=A0A6J4R8A9_9BACT|nr:MAG: hypothetical protein AVDCRST_MAG96-12 [uncultured Segetibacter sp.]
MSINRSAGVYGLRTESLFIVSRFLLSALQLILLNCSQKPHNLL